MGEHIVKKYLFLSCLIVPIVLNAKVSNLPVELERYAEMKGCKPVDNFYNEAVDPPYVFGLTKDVNERGKRHYKQYSVAFWCQKKDANIVFRSGVDDNKPFLMIFKYNKSKYIWFNKNKENSPLSCPEMFEFGRMPGGLTVEFVDSENTENYRFVSNNKEIEQNSTMSGFSLISTAGDVGAKFMCYKNKWVVKLLH